MSRRPSGPAPRKGYSRRDDIPPGLIRAMNEGREETRTLAEWLAIDPVALLRAVLPDVGLDRDHEGIAAAAARMAAEGVTARTRGIGRLLFRALGSDPEKRRSLEALASHPSDMVRGWAAYAVSADGTLPLGRRLRLARRFAADSGQAVRECAWDSIRPHLAADLGRGIRLLEAWVRDPDPNVRRCAVEATRPRGVWCTHIETLKEDPAPSLPLLEPVRADPSRYVQRSVANWINDASKTRPDWARRVCARWRRESPAPETAWIVARALRTLAKAKTPGKGVRRSRAG